MGEPTKPVKRPKRIHWLTISIDLDLKREIKRRAISEVEGVFGGNVSAYLNWFIRASFGEIKHEKQNDK